METLVNSLFSSGYENPPVAKRLTIFRASSILAYHCAPPPCGSRNVGTVGLFSECKESLMRIRRE